MVIQDRGDELENNFRRKNFLVKNNLRVLFYNKLICINYI